MHEATNSKRALLMSEGHSLSVINCAQGSFVFNEGDDGEIRPFDVSTNKKWPYRGVFYPRSEPSHDGIAAVALFYSKDNLLASGRESAALAQGTLCGVGPRLLAQGIGARPDDPKGLPLYVIVEEDAGISLEAALKGGVIPGCFPHKLSPDADSEVGAKETAKILFDVGSQLLRLHRRNLRHGDVKAANVCLMSIGPDPWDIRATVIDMDLTTQGASVTSLGETESYHNRLLSSGVGVSSAAGHELTSLEYDLGCLALVACETRRRRPLGELDVEDIAAAFKRDASVFGYDEVGRVRVVQIDESVHLAPLARQAGLQRLCDVGLSREEMAGRPPWISETDFVDMKDVRELRRLLMGLSECQDAIARRIFENYNAQLIEDGEEVKYPDFDSQPADYRHSNYEQAANMVYLIERLGYEVVPLAECSESARLTSFSDAQVELMAQWEHERWVEERLSSGWVLGETRDGRGDPDHKVSPYLRPYEELDDAIKDYDRRPVREIIPILEEAGFAVRKK